MTTPQIKTGVDTAGGLGGHVARIRESIGGLGTPPATGLGGDIDSLVSRNHESTKMRLGGAGDTVTTTQSGSSAMVDEDQNNASKAKGLEGSAGDPAKAKAGDISKGLGGANKVSAADLAKLNNGAGAYQSSMPTSQTAPTAPAMSGMQGLSQLPNAAMQGLQSVGAPFQSMLGAPGNISPMLDQMLSKAASTGGMDGGPASLAMGQALPGDAGKVQALTSKWLGTPYAWGGGGMDGPSQGIHDGGGPADRAGDYNKVGFDCSGWSRYLTYQAFGVTIPRTTWDQMTVGMAVTPETARVGDLIFPSDANGGHVAVYMGNGQMAEAPSSGQTLKLSPMRAGMIRTYH